MYVKSQGLLPVNDMLIAALLPGVQLTLDPVIDEVGRATTSKRVAILDKSDPNAEQYESVKLVIE